MFKVDKNGVIHYYRSLLKNGSYRTNKEVLKTIVPKFNKGPYTPLSI